MWDKFLAKEKKKSTMVITIIWKFDPQAMTLFALNRTPTNPKLKALLAGP